MEPQLQTFIIIKYGDNQEAIANPFCSTHALLEWMRRKSHCDDDSVLDLVDLEGQVKNLPSSTEEYANDYVTGRETYILIRVDKQADSTGTNRYVSLLNNLDDLHPDLMGENSVTPGCTCSCPTVTCQFQVQFQGAIKAACGQIFMRYTPST